ncbi:hypothetical protein GCM10011504_28130 [Siccirubricoccus deserti]|uniref:Uncharacterized protein n=1 Tax=Siccirubricoccus deserti TaxID=2013562 RepID=A0A9X0UHH3_9PROT|nr:hypothetical protein [Siccirubricoccus deserti]MBC4016210.1 hypothetical protein [Siccirubricoccus deserti]GGC48065.1 hypothetical protein GCM10011504_28130 [Siccirubricoccus deserti]
MRRIATLVALLPLAGCAVAPASHAVLPNDAVVGAGDPTRAAIIGSAYAFASPGTMAGRPDAAARAAAQVEFLATEIPAGPRWTGYDRLVGQELVAARDELRLALGVAPDAPPQVVVDALYNASRALRSGDQAAAALALPGPVFRDGPATLARLGDLPPLPRTRLATALTNQEFLRVEQDGRINGGGDGGKD